MRRSRPKSRSRAAHRAVSVDPGMGHYGRPYEVVVRAIVTSGPKIGVIRNVTVAGTLRG